MMNIRIQTNCAGIDWKQVSRILKMVEMASFSGDVHQQCFENSQTVVFVFDGTTLVGFGRAISDGVRQAAIYDVAVLPEYQGKGIGRKIIYHIVEANPGCNFILYSSPGKEGFYEKLNFRRMKTGMAKFVNPEWMQGKGFTV